MYIPLDKFAIASRICVGGGGVSLSSICHMCVYLDDEMIRYDGIDCSE